MANKHKVSIVWQFGGIGFVLGLLFMTMGFGKTLFIVVLTVIASYLGYLVTKYDINFSNLTSIFSKK